MKLCHVLGATAALLVVGAGPAGAFLVASARTVVPLTVDVLGVPGVSVARIGEAVVVTPVRPDEGPAPTGYLVSRVGSGASVVVVCPQIAPGQSCTDPAPDGGTYVVTGRLGAHWARDSAPVSAPALPAVESPPSPPDEVPDPGSGTDPDPGPDAGSEESG